MPKVKLKLNTAQIVTRDTYARGDMVFVQHRGDIEKSGDGLFKFLMSELADEPGEKMTQDEAIRRVQTAIVELQELEGSLANPKNWEAR